MPLVFKVHFACAFNIAKKTVISFAKRGVIVALFVVPKHRRQAMRARVQGTQAWRAHTGREQDTYIRYAGKTCGACIAHCPQGIDTPQVMERLAG